MEIQNRKIPEGEFMAMRQEVLQQWPTGRDVDLTEAAAYQKQQKPSRNFSARLIEAKKEHRTLIQRDALLQCGLARWGKGLQIGTVFHIENFPMVAVLP